MGFYNVKCKLREATHGLLSQRISVFPPNNYPKRRITMYRSKQFRFMVAPVLLALFVSMVFATPAFADDGVHPIDTPTEVTPPDGSDPTQPTEEAAIPPEISDQLQITENATAPPESGDQPQVIEEATAPSEPPVTKTSLPAYDFTHDSS